MRLIFVRHGEPDYQRDCLTENGILQAQKTAERLKNEEFSAIWSSPMGRAMETASYTAKSHGLAIRTLDFMHEIDWGDIETADDGGARLPHEGHPWTLAYRLRTEDPDGAESAWDEHPYFRNNRCMQYYRSISDHLDAFLADHGLVRNGSIYDCTEERTDTIALFAHGGSGAVLFSHILNLPFPFVLSSMPYGVCSVSVISFEEPTDGRILPRLELFNDMRHIDTYREEKLHFEK
ncbi:MAG: histidine phosphatase family protein [Lachnospiraceae bacterium]|nr:histidine phosphatase family protein [Lachnospiraceae bacterium]